MSTSASLIGHGVPPCIPKRTRAPLDAGIEVRAEQRRAVEKQMAFRKLTTEAARRLAALRDGEID